MKIWGNTYKTNTQPFSTVKSKSSLDVDIDVDLEGQIMYDEALGVKGLYNLSMAKLHGIHCIIPVDTLLLSFRSVIVGREGSL